jgi:hypothetical protein
MFHIGRLHFPPLLCVPHFLNRLETTVNFIQMRKDCETLTSITIVPRLRMYGALSPLSHTSLLRDAQLSTGITLSDDFEWERVGSYCWPLASFWVEKWHKVMPVFCISSIITFHPVDRYLWNSLLSWRHRKQPQRYILLGICMVVVHNSEVRGAL